MFYGLWLSVLFGDAGVHVCDESGICRSGVVKTCGFQLLYRMMKFRIQLVNLVLNGFRYSLAFLGVVASHAKY